MASAASQKHKSLAWKLFKIDNEDPLKAVCQLCDMKISRGSKIGYCTTTNMLKHLSAKHSKELQDEKEKEIEKIQKGKKRILSFNFSSITKPKKVATECLQQITLEKSINKQKIWDMNDHKAQKIHKLIGEMIAVDLQPFSIVEDIGFIRLINHICPNYNIPSRKYLKEKTVQDIYVLVRNKIAEEINGASHLSFTSDCWTASTANTSFLSLTAHWITDNYELKSAVLRVAPFDVSHTAYNISEYLKNTMNQFNIPYEKIHVIVRDNASNITAGVAQAKYNSLPCFLHTLQLILNDAIFEQRYIKDIICICKQIVGHFNHSPTAFAKYEEYQKKFDLPQHRFIQDVQTRWNSQYYMLSRISEQKTALISYCSEHQKPTCLDTNQWKILEKLLKILKHFVDSTIFLSNRNATASGIIPNIKVICHFFDTGLEKGLFDGLGSTLLAWKVSVKTRFDVYLKDKNLILATYLDPRFKTTFLENKYNDANTQEALEKWLSEDIFFKSDCNSETECTSEAADLSDLSDDSKNEENDFNFSFESYFSKLKKDKIIGGQNKLQIVQVKKGKEREALKNEMANYQALRMISNDENPLQWWKINKDSFPNMARLARKFLCAPPSSVESERLFSIGGMIYSPKRNRMQAETGEMLMFLHYNLRILNFTYE